MKNLIIIALCFISLSIQAQYSDLYLKVEELKNTKFTLPPKDSRGDWFMINGKQWVCNTPDIRINDEPVSYDSLNNYQLSSIYKIWYIQTTAQNKLWQWGGRFWVGAIAIYTNDYPNKQKSPPAMPNQVYLQYYPAP